MQKKDPKYILAWYLDEQNCWQSIYFKELTDENKRAIARTKELYNEKEGNIYLGVRSHESTPHFFKKKDIRNLIAKGFDKSEHHKFIINKLIEDYLCKDEFKKIKFGFYERPWEKEKKDKGFDTIIKVEDYIWSKEQGFGLVYGKYIIFDMLGRSDCAIGLLDKKPYIAIEVIDTHFHNYETFKSLVELTKNLPFIVMYYFTGAYPRLNQPIFSERKNSASKIRVYCYLFDGSFWIQKTRIEDEEGILISPENENEYYELISHRLVELNLINTKT